MKEATGELSTTMITIVAIAAILTIFTLVLLPYLRNAIKSRLHCAEAYDCVCDDGSDSCSCKYDVLDDDGNPTADGVGKTVNCRMNTNE